MNSDKPLEFDPGDDLSVRTINAIASEMVRYLHENSSVVLKLDSEASVDISFVQLIEAARAYAKNHASEFRLGSPASGQLLEVLKRGGFLPPHDSQQSAFWLCKEIQ